LNCINCNPVPCWTGNHPRGETFF